jgi:TP901 family phage tail tape measure protein
VDNANKTIKGFEDNISSATGSLSGMVSAFRSGDILGFASGAKTAGGAIKSLIPAIGGATAAVGGLGAAINLAMGPVGWIVAAVSGIVAVGVAAGKSVEEFNTSLKGLSALTGATGSDLKEIGQSAKELSMEFGTSATSIVDSFKLIGSQAPQLLKDKEGLEGVTEAALVLSKAAGMSVEDAAKGITTVMNQMGVEASEATGIINSLAAGSKEGAADVEYLQTAIEKSGTQASNAGMSYQQLIATIETLAPKFSSADVAGTALNGVLIKLTTQANNDFNPAIVGLDKALENLDNANLSAAEKLKIFGESNLSAANTLIQNREALQGMTEAVSNTNTAYEQMETVGGTLSESFNKLKATWNAWMISIGESASMQFTIGIIKQIIEHITRMIRVLVWVQDAWNTVTSIISALVSKMWNNYIKPVWDNIANAITNSAIFKAASKLWNSLLDAIHKVFKQIAEWWNDFLEWLGIGGSAKVAVKQEVSVDTQVDDNYVSPEVTPTTTSGVKTPKGGSTTKKEAPVKGSLSDTEAQINALQAQLKNTNTNDTEAINSLKARIAELQKVADQQKIELGLVTPPSALPSGSLKDIQNQLSKAKEQLQLVNPDDTLKVEELQATIKSLTEQEHQIKVSLGLVEIKPQAVEGSLKHIQQEIAKWKAIMEVSAIESPEYKEVIAKLLELTALEQEIKVKIDTDSKPPELISKEQKQAINDAHDDMYDGIKSSWGAANGLVDSITQISEGFEDMSGIEIVQSLGDTIFSVIDNVTSLIDGITAFSSALQATSAIQQATSAASIASTQAEATASIANTAAKSGEAIAGATASGAKMPFPANLIAIAAGIAAVVGALAMISGFAGGGIVGGSSTIGDYNVIRANKGEMILNSTQQANLFRMLNSGGAPRGMDGEVKFKISGKELIGVLNNYNRKTAKVK